jgi:hypothetical protein
MEQTLIQARWDRNEGQWQLSPLELASTSVRDRELQIGGASVDHVQLVGGLTEVPDRIGALLELRRLLRDGGHLSVSDEGSAGMSFVGELLVAGFVPDGGNDPATWRRVS